MEYLTDPIETVLDHIEAENTQKETWQTFSVTQATDYPTSVQLFIGAKEKTLRAIETLERGFEGAIAIMNFLRDTGRDLHTRFFLDKI